MWHLPDIYIKYMRQAYSKNITCQQVRASEHLSTRSCSTVKNENDRSIICDRHCYLNCNSATIVVVKLTCTPCLRKQQATFVCTMILGNGDQCPKCHWSMDESIVRCSMLCRTYISYKWKEWLMHQTKYCSNVRMSLSGRRNKEINEQRRMKQILHDVKPTTI